MSAVLRTGVVGLVSIGLLACSSPPAPVEDRSTGASVGYRLTEQGIYRVQTGDTLYSIAFHYGVDWKDVARWNGIDRPYTIWPGQELRLTAPARGAVDETAITTRPAGQTPRATTRTADAAGSGPEATETGKATTPSSAGPPAQSATSPTVAAASAPAPTPARAASPPPGPVKDPQRWLWPTEGRVIGRFSGGEPARKGIDIAGEEGQDVVASAAGDVVYSGSGLIGFGELIIIKHSDSMLTAYAHNRRRLVQEGERVAAGSRIAEMGRNDKEQTMLHFELRIDGKPVDPLRYLPPR